MFREMFQTEVSFFRVCSADDKTREMGNVDSFKKEPSGSSFKFTSFGPVLISL